MKKLLLLPFLFIVAILFASGQSTLCLKLYCADTVNLPTNTMPLVAIPNSTDPLTNHGWVQVSGPNKVTIAVGDSVIISGLIAGNYSFRYTVSNSKGLTQTGIDNVVVNAAPIITPPPPPARTVTGFTLSFVNGVLVAHYTFSDGTTQ